MLLEHAASTQSWRVARPSTRRRFVWREGSAATNKVQLSARSHAGTTIYFKRSSAVGGLRAMSGERAALTVENRSKSKSMQSPRKAKLLMGTRLKVKRKRQGTCISLTPDASCRLLFGDLCRHRGLRPPHQLIERGLGRRQEVRLDLFYRFVAAER